MPECIKCGEPTKFEEGLCYKCYKKENKSKEDVIVEKTITKKKKSKDVKFNTFNYNLTKGRIAETLIERLFVDLGFQVFQYGMENTIPGIKDLLSGIEDEVAMNIRRMPDLVVFKDDRAHFIEVKFRADGCFKLKDIDKNGDYPYKNALIALVSRRHIKCISYAELKSGIEISDKDHKYLGSRKEFDTDKEKIKEYCLYAVKFFENV